MISDEVLSRLLPLLFSLFPNSPPLLLLPPPSLSLSLIYTLSFSALFSCSVCAYLPIGYPLLGILLSTYSIDYFYPPLKAETRSLGTYPAIFPPSKHADISH